jgi:hypothetical protein
MILLNVYTQVPPTYHFNTRENFDNCEWPLTYMSRQGMSLRHIMVYVGIPVSFLQSVSFNHSLFSSHFYFLAARLTPGPLLWELQIGQTSCNREKSKLKRNQCRENHTLVAFNPLRMEVYFCHQNQNAKNIGIWKVLRQAFRWCHYFLNPSTLELYNFLKFSQNTFSL